MYRLEMVDDIGRIFSVAIPEGKPVISIGRSENNDVVLTEESISRNHARILVKEEGLAIEDLGSSNGVLINDKRIAQQTPIIVGDEILIGDCRLFLKESKPADSSNKTMMQDEGEQGNVVLVKFMNGKILRGQTLDLGSKAFFHIINAQGKKFRIRFEDLKAVFLLKSPEELGAKQIKTRYGKKMLFRFFDGEIIVGTAVNFSEGANHFICFPLDETDNNDRIIVNPKALKYSTELDPQYGDQKAMDPIEPLSGDVGRSRLKNLASREAFGVAYDLYKSDPGN